MVKYPFNKFPPSQDEFKSWWKVYQKENPILKNKGTWIHRLASLIHCIGKITALIPDFNKKIEPPKVYLDSALKLKLEEKYDRYKEMIKGHQDEHGFIITERCDSLLFSSLLSCSLNNVNIKAARDSQGWWHRRPLSYPNCFPNSSASSISRDMITGLIWYLYFNKDLTAAEETLELYKKHSFVMGQGDPSRLILMPGLEATIASIIYKLGGKSRWFTRHQRQTYPKNLTGYEVHLLVLHALLISRLSGHIRSNVLDSFKAYAEKNPCNALHQFAYSLYIDGNMNMVTELLLNEGWWPTDRLPTNRDRDSEWLTSRDCDYGYSPSPNPSPIKEFTGGDFIFVAWLVLESLKSSTIGE